MSQAIMKKLLSLYLSGQFGRFILCGSTAALLHWLSRILFNSVVNYKTAIVLAYLVGLGVAFYLNKRFVFPGSERTVRTEAAYFVAANVVAFPFVWVVAVVLGEQLLPHWFAPQIALAIGHAIAICIPVFVNFLIHKFYTFRGA